MTEDQAHYRKHLFSVRVWLEESGAGQTEWRGKVQYVPNGEVRYFREWPSLAAIMQAMLPDATTDPVRPDTAD
jgi:hypothetical protein